MTELVEHFCNGLLEAPFTAKVTLYHATTPERWATIQHIGLKPFDDRTGKVNAAGGSAGSAVWFAQNPNNAYQHAVAQAAKKLLLDPHAPPKLPSQIIIIKLKADLANRYPLEYGFAKCGEGFCVTTKSAIPPTEFAGIITRQYDKAFAFHRVSSVTLQRNSGAEPLVRNPQKFFPGIARHRDLKRPCPYKGCTMQPARFA